jgi:transketolase
MRKTFQETLYKEMLDNDSIFLLTGDLGYKMWDNHFAGFPNRTINCGAAEQAMLDIAVGLAYDGKIPVCYSITPFLIYRPFETIRTYIDHEKLPVKLVGSGRNRDYSHDGMSHWADDVGLYLNNLKNIEQFWPTKKSQIKKMTKELLTNGKPSFISLRR